MVCDANTECVYRKRAGHIVLVVTEVHTLGKQSAFKLHLLLTDPDSRRLGTRPSLMAMVIILM